jgi:ribosomal protein S18 acetylase RimI-like enzyme
LKELVYISLIAMIQIRKIGTKDPPVIAKLHIDHMPLTFPPSRYYFNLLKLNYSYFLDNNKAICHLATIENNIVGYVCVLRYAEKNYLNAFRKFPVQFCGNAVMLLLRFPTYFFKRASRVLRILLSLRVGKQTATPDFGFLERHYELRPIVVKKDLQGTTVAERLISCAESVLVKKSQKKYFLRVKKDNPRAIAFYHKMGFTTIGDEGIRIVMMKDIM